MAIEPREIVERKKHGFAAPLSRLEPFGAVEGLADQQRADGLAVLPVDQAALGLVASEDAFKRRLSEIAPSETPEASNGSA